MKQSGLREMLSRKMLMLFLLGFSSGLPFLLTAGTLKLWLAREKVDLSVIGYFSWVGMAYSFKFIWSPLLDRFSLSGFGRRRSWMMISQAMIALGLVAVGNLNPAFNLSLMAVLCIFVAFFSATQDIAIDAYRREICTDQELGLATTVHMYGYRASMLVSGGIGVGLVGAETFNLSWGQLYFLMAALMTVGFVVTLLAPEPSSGMEHRPRTLMAAVVDPIREFFQRRGALMILLFVFLYKFGDAMGAAVLSPFYVQMGYSNQDIALIAKTFGLVAAMVGLLLGSLVIMKLGVYKSLWVFGVMQGLATAAYSLITFTGPQTWALAVATACEDISQGMGNAAFLTFIALVCNRRYTAFQYAVLSSVATLGRNFFSGYSGDLAKILGWDYFFYTCGLLSLPGLIVLIFMRRYETEARDGSADAVAAVIV